MDLGPRTGEQYTWRVIRNRVPRRIFGTKREDVIIGWIIFLVAYLTTLSLSKLYIVGW